MTVTARQQPRAAVPGAGDLVLFGISITNNDPLFGRFLEQLRLTNTTTGPGTVSNRDAELGALRLYRDNGNQVFDPGIDVLVAGAMAAGGTVTFPSLHQSCPAGASANFLVVTNVPLSTRDGDALDVSIQSSSDVTFDQSVTFDNAFPLAPTGTFPVDGLSAAQIRVGDIASTPLLGGTTNNLVLNVVAPANGYEADQLQELAVVNLGSAVVGADIGALRVWIDDGDTLFDPARDRLLGTLAYTGARWQRSALSEPVPLSGLRLFFAVDVAAFATHGHTIRLALPAATEPGVKMASGNDGPTDQRVESSVERAVSTSNRVTLTATSLAPAAIRPGEGNVTVLHLLATNSYSSVQRLGRLTVHNAGVGGTSTDRDHAVDRLVLRADGDGDGALGDSLTDPVLAVGSFAGGVSSFGPLDHALPPGVTTHLFLTASASLDAADGDSLSARVEDPADVDLGDTTRVVASWPLDSHARVVVDGMVASQMTVGAVPMATLAPGDSNVVALDVTVPRNGHADDTLVALQIANSGTADTSDITEVRLWRDGGDGSRTPGTGDDRDLGVLAWTGTSWSRSGLNEPLGAGGARLWAVIRWDPLESTCRHASLSIL